MKANNTSTTMNTTEIAAPKFSELSHAATNIVLAAENTSAIYNSRIKPLLRSLRKKAAKGAALSVAALAVSYAMGAVIHESIDELTRTCYDPICTTSDDRRAAALYLANVYISEI